MMFEGVRNILKAIVSPIATQLLGWFGGYNATDPTRKLLDRSEQIADRSTANQLLSQSLTV